MTGRITIDRDKCIGSGQCVFRAPDIFDLDDDGYSYVKVHANAERDAVSTAVANCPADAISFEGRLDT